MNIFSMILSAASDNIMLLAQVFLTSAITGHRISGSRTAASSLIVIMFNVIYEAVCFDSITTLRYAMALIRIVYLCLLSLYILKIHCIRHILLLLIIQFICSVTGSEISSVLQFNDEMIPKSYHLISLSAVSLILLIIAVIINKKTDHDTAVDKSAVIPDFIYILIIIVIFIEDGIIECLNFPSYHNDAKIRIITFLLIPLVIFTTALIISLSVNTVHKSHYLMLNHILENQVKCQLAHYEKMEQVNREIRRFRHDYNNHINCIVSMIKNNRNEEVLSHINDMSGKLPSDRFTIKTGNYIADAILSDKQAEAETHDTRITFEGCIISEINSTDLCIILSNALDNAIEACSDIPGDKKISVFGGYQHSCFVLIVKNPARIEWESSRGLPPSSKKDSTDHGLGLSNISSAVRKYNGTMNISAENGVFVLGVSFDPRRNS